MILRLVDQAIDGNTGSSEDAAFEAPFGEFGGEPTA